MFHPDFLEQFLTMEYILLIPIVAGFLSFAVSKVNRILRDIVSVLASLFVAVLVFFSYGKNISFLHTYNGAVNITLGMHNTTLGWFFAIVIAGLGFLTFLYNVSYEKEKKYQPYFHLYTNMFITAMLGIVYASDLITLFLFWEFMSILSYLLVKVRGDDAANRSGFKYIVISISSAYFILMGIILFFAKFGTVNIDALRALVASGAAFTGKEVFVIIFLFFVGFGTKAAIVPLHIWAPGAYRDSPSSFTGLFSGATSKLGIFGIMLIIFYIFTPQNSDLAFIGTYKNTPFLMYIIAVCGAFTAMVGTLFAIMQDDVKKLLAYSSIAQIGYIIAGIGMSSGIGIAGALFHVINHALFKGALFFGLGIVIMRLGTTKIHEMGGIVHKMPLTFLPVLFSIFSVAAIPITSGFISKWFLYEAAMHRGYYIMLPMMFIASVGAFLYLFRILHPVFLGQLHEKYKDVKEAPIPVLAVLWILAGATIFFAVFPGYILEVIRNIEINQFGFSANASSSNYIGWEMDGMSKVTIMKNGITFGVWNSLTAFVAFDISFVIVLLLWGLSAARKRVGLRDTFVSGEYISQDMNMHVAWHFYRPIERLMHPYLKGIATWLFRSWKSCLEFAGEISRRVYNGSSRYYSLYMALSFLFVVLVIYIKMGWWSI